MVRTVSIDLADCFDLKKKNVHLILTAGPATSLCWLRRQYDLAFGKGGDCEAKISYHLAKIIDEQRNTQHPLISNRNIGLPEKISQIEVFVYMNS